jgi:CRP-like cAMP-binding protein
MGKIKTIHTSPFFESFSATELALLSTIAEERQLVEGEWLCQEGESNQSMFILADGELSVFQSSSGDTPLTTIGVGEVIGEMSLLYPTEHLVSIQVSSEKAKLACIHRDGVHKLLKTKPELALKLLHSIGNIVHQKLQISLAIANPPE